MNAIIRSINFHLKILIFLHCIYQTVGAERTNRAKRTRLNFDNNQIVALERQFKRSKYIALDERYNLAKALNLTERRIKVWFQNRRCKESRENRNSLDLKKINRRNSGESPSTTDTSSRYATPSPPLQWDHQIISPDDLIQKMPEPTTTMQHQFDQTIYSPNYLQYAVYPPIQLVQLTPPPPPPPTCAIQNVQPQLLLSPFSNGNNENASTFENASHNGDYRDYKNDLVEYCVSEDSTKSYDLSTANFEHFIQQNANTSQQVHFIDQNESLNLSLNLNISDSTAKSLIDLSAYWQTFEKLEHLG